jgi:hypothetical protein
MHGLRNKNGERLVLIEIGTDDLSGWYTSGRTPSLTVHVFEPASVLRNPRWLSTDKLDLHPGVPFESNATVHAPSAARIFVGEADPKNPRRFTIRYQINGEEGAIVGRLRDNDHAELTAVSGPGLQRWQWWSPPQDNCHWLPTDD